jgi:hypothetical protein
MERMHDVCMRRGCSVHAASTPNNAVGDSAPRAALMPTQGHLGTYVAQRVLRGLRRRVHRVGAVNDETPPRVRKQRLARRRDDPQRSERRESTPHRQVGAVAPVRVVPVPSRLDLPDVLLPCRRRVLPAPAARLAPATIAGEARLTSMGEGGERLLPLAGLTDPGDLIS